jgi:thiol-disulfide isomerase/thioredoxin
MQLVHTSIRRNPLPEPSSSKPRSSQADTPPKSSIPPTAAEVVIPANWRQRISTACAQVKQRRFWLSLIRDVSLLLIIGFAIASYQQRHMLKDIAPSLNMLTTQGSMAFSSYANDPKAKLVYFFGTWCPVCRFTSPEVMAIAQDYPTIAIALASGNDDQLNSFMTQQDYQFDVINDDNGSISEIWGVQAVPAFYILDEHNKIVFVTSGASSQWGLRLRLCWASL